MQGRQCGIYPIVVYIETSAFTRRLHKLCGSSADVVLSGIQSDLLKNPLRGDIVQGLGGVRKARYSNPLRGKGTRGGYRYLFLYIEYRDHVHLLYFLDKNEQEDLTNEERNVIRGFVAAIKAANRSTE